MRFTRILLAVAVLATLLTPSANAQYFGRNKVQWEAFHFKRLRTEHFDIYYYDQEADVVNDIGRMAERWYARLSRTFQHSFAHKPIVLYANAADFQQTTTTGELIGEGTGGFTDEYMNRVVLPLTGDYAENDHVLGHELVHVFQYDIAASVSSTNGNANRRRFNLEQLPLWLVEGMAEYFSKGRIDPLTAMWIRDASIHNHMPDLKKLTQDPRYFPYRYGQALLAYIGGRFGDDAVVRYFLAAGQVGIDQAFDRVLGLPSKRVFTDWQESARELYDPVVAERPLTPGTMLIGEKPDPKRRSNGTLNLGPALSPDGRYLAFLSTRELFDVDLFLADARTGRVIRRLVSTDRDAHLDALRFIDSGGAWSPDSRRLAFVTFERGDNYLGIVNAEGGRIEEIRVPGVDSLTNPTWSPDNHTIAFSGQTTGVTDLFLYDTTSKQVRRLTNDKFADLQPAFSPDGKMLAFISDRGASSTLDQLRFNEMQISTIDIETGSIKTLPLFQNTKHINPQWGPNGNLYFIANPDGVPDIYRYNFGDGNISRITHAQTGVAGITDLSPALAVAGTTGDIVFSLYESDNYNLYSIPANPVGTQVAATTAGEAPRGAVLPPYRATGSQITQYLNAPLEGLLPESATSGFQTLGIDHKMHVAYVGPPTIGVGVSQYGTGVGGSVSAYFSDVLGQQNVGVSFQGAGTGTGNFFDQLGGEAFYLNQTHRVNWGADFSHIPYVSVGTGYQQVPVDVGGQTVLADQYLQETDVETIDNFSLLGQYPFSSTRRIEASGGYQRYAQKSDIEALTVVDGTIIDDERIHVPGTKFSLNMFTASAAFVGDSSVFGFVSPVRGTRYRYEFTTLTGDLRFQTVLADYRKYFFFRPVTVAVRALHYGRYGSDAEDPRLTPLYVGDIGLIRGYDPYSISPDECVGTTTGCPVFDRLAGSRIAIGSVEARVPLLGVQGYGLINAPYVPTEGFAFADVGTAWNQGEHPKLKYATNTTERVPVFSLGAGVRVLLAYIPLEFYAAKPFQRPGKGIVYGFNIIPGW